MKIDRIPQGCVGLGSTVTLRDFNAGDEVTYELVIPEIADLEKGLVSIASPIGKGLLNKEEGDVVTIAIPSGSTAP